MTERRLGVLGILFCLLGAAGYSLTYQYLTTEAAGDSNRDELEVQCIGTLNGWSFRHSGPDGKLQTEDDSLAQDILALPAARTVRLRLTSHDYLFRLAQKELGLNAVAIPGREIQAVFTTPRNGEYEFESQPMCGMRYLGSHREARIVIVPSGTN